MTQLVPSKKASSAPEVVQAVQSVADVSQALHLASQGEQRFDASSKFPWGQSL